MSGGRKINVLVTTVGGIEKYEMILELSALNEFYFNNIGKIIACDIKDSVSLDTLRILDPDKILVELIKPSNDPDYLDSINQVCESHEVDLILPIDTLECIKLSNYKKSSGIYKGLDKAKVACSSNLQHALGSKSTQLAVFKGTDLVDEYAVIEPNDSPGIVNSILNHFKSVLLGLGYSKMVMKPDFTNGSRGLRVAELGPYNLKDYFEEKTAYFCTIDELNSIATKFVSSSNYKDNKLILQPFYGGVNYNVDCYKATDGTLVVVPQKVVGDRWGQVKGSELVDPKRFLPIAKLISDKLMLDNNFNFEVSENHNGELKLVEVNPRLSAVIPQVMRTNFDLIELTIRDLIMGQSISEFMKDKQLELDQFQSVFLTLNKNLVNLQEDENF